MIGSRRSTAAVSSLRCNAGRCRRSSPASSLPPACASASAKGDADRNRDRFRLRFGAKIAVNEETELGFKLASGASGDPISNNQTFTDTFSVFVPGVEPERVATSFAQRLGALGSFAFDVVGEMWARPGLSRRDRSLIVVSTLAAQARDDELEVHTAIAIRNGLTRVEIEEIVVTVAAYAGFPAAMAANRRVDAGLRSVEGVERLSERTAAAAKSDAERDRDAADVFAAISAGRGGTDPVADLGYLSKALGGVGVLAYRWALP